jgi:CRP-like cAMP-binding protein
MTEEPFDFASLIRHGVKFRRCDAGERIFLEHDTGDCLYVVHTGRVDVITFGTVLESVGPNGIFGEMALIDDGPRSAAALTSEPTELAVVDKTTFLTLVREEPRAKARGREANAQLVALRELLAHDALARNTPIAGVIDGGAVRDDADAPPDQRPVEPERIGRRQQVDRNQEEVDEHIGREVDLESCVFEKLLHQRGPSILRPPSPGAELLTRPTKHPKRRCHPD